METLRISWTTHRFFSGEGITLTFSTIESKKQRFFQPHQFHVSQLDFTTTARAEQGPDTIQELHVAQEPRD